MNPTSIALTINHWKIKKPVGCFTTAASCIFPEGWDGREQGWAVAKPEPNLVQLRLFSDLSSSCPCCSLFSLVSLISLLLPPFDRRCIIFISLVLLFQFFAFVTTVYSESRKIGRRKEARRIAIEKPEKDESERGT